MLYGREILGLPVYTMEKKILGTVKNYEADQSGVLESLIITTHGMLSKDFRIPAQQIASVSLKGVFIKDKKVLQKAPKNINSTSFVGAGVYDKTGNCIGNISDIMVENAHICAVELSKGVYDDLCSGRQKINFENLRQSENGFTCE